MSVKVDLNQLAAKLTDYTFAYLVTVDDSYHAHTVAVEPQMVDGVIDVGPVGGHTRSNLALHDEVTLIWPPRKPGGYSLIVDGRGQPAAGDDETQQVVPSRAVLHRKASSRAAAPGTNDCVVLSEN
ncbi:pyridoxamine 5'-phosphate oxidase family protein [Mycolicibacterium sp. XJ870]